MADDVLGCNLGLAAPVGLLGEKLACLQDPLGGAVAVAAVLHSQIGDDLFHPQGNHFTFGNRVANVLHVGVDAESSELFGNVDDSPNLVSQFAGTDMNNVVAHDFLPVKVKRP
jgi:hypothetical protein